MSGDDNNNVDTSLTVAKQTAMMEPAALNIVVDTWRRIHRRYTLSWCPYVLIKLKNNFIAGTTPVVADEATLEGISMSDMGAPAAIVIEVPAQARAEFQTEGAVTFTQDGGEFRLTMFRVRSTRLPKFLSFQRSRRLLPARYRWSGISVE